MKLAGILAGTILAFGSLTLVATAAPQGAIVVAQNDQHKDEHKAPPPPPNKGGGPPPNHAPAGGPNNHGGPGPMGGPSHMGGQMGGPNHMGGQMGGPNHMMGHAGPPANFNKQSYQRNFNAPRHFHIAVYVRPAGWYSHRWVYGEILPALFWSQNYWINDYYDYGLADPPAGFIWVRYGDDALLIDQNSGEVLQVEYGLFD